MNNCITCGSRPRLHGFKSCGTCLNAKAQAAMKGGGTTVCQTANCNGWTMAGKTVCVSCSTKAASKATSTFPTMEEFEALQAEVATLHTTVGLLIEILAFAHSNGFSKITQIADLWKEAKALHGDITRSEVIKDLTTWEGELNGEEC